MGITVISSMKEIPKPPTKLVKSLNNPGGLPTPDNDGSYITITYTQFAKYNTAGNPIWSVAPTDINTNCDRFTGCAWLDTSDSAIWVWAYDSGTTPDTYYLAKIALSDGAITNIGTCQPGDGYFEYYFERYYNERASMGSGNLTIRDGDYKIVLSTTDGSIVSAATQVTQNGIAIDSYANYETADGSIYWVGTADTGPTVKLKRGGLTKQIRLPDECYWNGGYPRLWGGYVAIKNNYSPTFFNRTDFDNWLAELADFYGLPE